MGMYSFSTYVSPNHDVTNNKIRPKSRYSCMQTNIVKFCHKDIFLTKNKIGGHAMVNMVTKIWFHFWFWKIARDCIRHPYGMVVPIIMGDNIMHYILVAYVRRIVQIIMQATDSAQILYWGHPPRTKKRGPRKISIWPLISNMVAMGYPEILCCCLKKGIRWLRKIIMMKNYVLSIANVQIRL